MDNGLDMEDALIMEPLDGSFLDVSVEHEVESTPEKTFECSICDKRYTSRSNLKRHIKIHDDRFQFVCRKCPIFFETKEEFDNHNERMHIKKLLCMECGKQFFSKSNLSSHVKLLHSKSSSDPGNALICPFDNCGKRFTIKPKYQDHLSLHSGLKPHSCLKCGKQYWNRYSKKDHEKICCGEAKITCHECNADFADRSALMKQTDAQHKKRQHICLDCGKKYLYVTSLSRHRSLKHKSQ